MPALNLKLITPERIVFEEPVETVIARGTEGEFEVLPGHEPLVASLAVDVLRFKRGGEDHFAAVMGGVLEVRQVGLDKDGKAVEPGKAAVSVVDEVTILSDIAELDVEIDTSRAKQAKERAEAEKTQRVDKIDVYISEMAISRAITRLKAAELRQRRRKPGAN